MDLKDPQIRSLRWAILKRICLSVFLYTVGVFLIFSLMDGFLKPFIVDVLRYEILQDDRVYHYFSSSYVPICFLLYVIGLLAILRSGATYALSYFAQLFSAVESVIRHDKQPISLPQELSRTALALNALKEESERNERAAKAAEERKNELVVYLAHDIKTPLTSIVGHLSLLQESPDIPLEQRARYTQTMLDKAYRLEELLDEFFEITRYNLQNIPIERTHFDANVLCQQLIDEFYPQAQSRKLEIHLEAPSELPVFADGNRLARILNNVLKNAIVYADENTKITLKASKTTLEDGRRYLALTVTNRGKEIAPHHLQHVFQKFYRGDNARSSASGGAGLGLAIAHEIARAHGGDITAASEQGITSFTVWIPQD